MTIVVPLILVPFFKQHDPAGSDMHMNDPIWQIPLTILTPFLTARSIPAPSLLDQEPKKRFRASQILTVTLKTTYERELTNSKKPSLHIPCSTVVVLHSLHRMMRETSSIKRT